MSVLVKGMKMPKDCPMCPCAHWNKLDKLTGCEIVWRYVPDSEIDYWQSDKRPNWCPLVEVPTPHGRLIDADALIKVLNACKYSVEKATMRQVTYNAAIGDVCRNIDRLPAIIEAEEGEGE